MPHPCPPDAPEFRRQMVDLVRAARDATDLPREFEPSEQAIRNWVAAADRQSGRKAEPAPDSTALTDARELRRSCGYNIEPILPVGDEVTRASSRSLEMHGGRVFLPESAPWRDELRAEMVAFPHGRPDVVDSISQFLLWQRERTQSSRE